VGTRVSVFLLLLFTLAFGLFGIERSLWVDEAWVANSVHAPTLGGMFYYPGWLQTSPPLFLLLERGAVDALGLSNAAFRAIPLALELAAAGLFFAAARRLVALPLAVLAAAAVAFHPIAIEYSRTAKQYSGELAVTAALLGAACAYFLRPSPRAFRVLLIALLAGMTLSYPTVFLIPGLIAALCATGARRQGGWLALASGAMLGILYLLFIRPNYSPELRDFWAASPERFWTAGSAAAIFLCAGALAWFLLAARRGEARANWMYCFCAAPGLLLAAASALGWYPASPRAWLFLLPCLAMLLALFADALLKLRPSIRIPAKAALWIAAAAIPAIAGWRQVHQHRNRPEEDLAGPVQFLRRHAAPGDLLLVHASVKEGFQLYAAMDGFTEPRPVYGATGWPCCVRGHLAPPHSSSRPAVIEDLQAKIPKNFTGRVWLMYSSRPTQWNYTGLDEGNLWRSEVWAMGCPPEPFVAFANVSLSPMNCGARAAPRSYPK
jgi:hypothetical protein